MAQGGQYWMNATRSTILKPIIPSSGGSIGGVLHNKKAEAKFLKVRLWEKCRSSSTASLTNSNGYSPKKKKEKEKKITRKNPRARHRLIEIQTSSDGNWKDKWTCDYIFSLQELELQDLAEEVEGQEDTQVSISLSIQKNVSFGLSVDGRIRTSLERKCIICSSPYCSKLDKKFKVWVLPSRRQRRNTPMPEIGGDDPSVIYVKPGEEADLDSLIQDTIRFASSFQETCSEACEESEPITDYVGEQQSPSTELRWSKLLQLKKAS